MPLSWNEIRGRARAFAKEWADESREVAEAKSFWDEFFAVFGLSRRRVATFERRVVKQGGQPGRIDLLWKGMLLVEHKSRGKDLTRAYKQAIDYFPGLRERELPRHILVSDFARFRLYDLDADERCEFALIDLHANIHRFAFIAGYQTHKIQAQDPVNIQAAERMGALHDQLRAIGYLGHRLEVYLVRLLFCMFAEDTGIFERQQFQNYIEERTAEDGADLAAKLDELFYVLNQTAAERLSARDEHLNAFPHINGDLFAERLAPAAFNSAMRESLLRCCALDWSRISPAIFGALFQAIMDPTARRNLGAHYTSEENILKVINPLFMDDLRAEFAAARNNAKKLFAFHKKLRALKFLDPACGCGNFLVIAYRELRLLELEILRAAKAGQQSFDVRSLIALDVDQFYGIEIKEFPVQVAQVAMLLIDHQMNMLVSREFGEYFARIPLANSAHILHANALTMDWRHLVQNTELKFIMGNPPFVGKSMQSKQQKEELRACYQHLNNAGIMDYCTAWYCKAVEYIRGTEIKCAFVSTNSITQGEQVAPLWHELNATAKTYIHFAHRSFRWSNEAKNNAIVSCVIISFAAHPAKTKWLFDYATPTAAPQAAEVNTINPYLVEAPDVVVESRRQPICDVTPMVCGSKPVDGGNLLLDADEKKELISREPRAKKWIRPYSMGDEFIHGIARFCLWLKDCPAHELKQMPLVMKRVDAVKKMRQASPKITTQQMAGQSTVFMELRQPASDYLAVPEVSTDRRIYIPIGYLDANHIAGGTLFAVADATRFDFGVITSMMHMAWMRAVAGRLGMGYRYSASIVYNNFPWPKPSTDKQRTNITNAAQKVLDARASFPQATLADLYHPLMMPPRLYKAHKVLDRAVDRAYRAAPFGNEADRAAYLFTLYQQYTAPMLPKEKTRRKRRRI